MTADPTPAIRPATVDDAEAITRCQFGGWQTFYRGILPEAMLAGLDPAEQTARRRTYLAEAPAATRNWVLELDGRVVGWACSGDARDDDRDAGTQELYALYLEPSEVGRGRGRALMQHVVADVAARGYEAMVLWVLEDNARSRRFYEAAGFRAEPGVERVRAFREADARKLRMRRTLGPA